MARATKFNNSAASNARRQFVTTKSSSNAPRLLVGSRTLVNYNNGPLLKCNERTALRQSIAVRTMASSSSSNNAKENQSSDSADSSSEIVLTPGEKVVAGTRLFFWAGAFGFASICAYYIGKELLPTKMSPNAIFDRASAVLHDNEDVKRRFGPSFKTYGRDHGGHREGRRNFIEHTDYTDPDDGSKRTRVRFNLEGEFGSAFVFAEVSKDMPSGEFVYIIVQDKRNGAAITVVDNRSALLAKRMAGGDEKGQNVFANLLAGGGAKDGQ
eukprot:CAMPEP_0196143626 /NCGR_PEP_ID=MMETSP0910-20130528/13632_1 /TAXON_ID=49265 /ORGANISM="Thalassiosira rotula, Strain GSO102" /LENGTH=268 /DNA_ID=CAMNT_0041405109 /DNA_START=122 /DNA_END=928 /DNA_ORIENTATION=+